jgi:hypothetical protein
MLDVCWRSAGTSSGGINIWTATLPSDDGPYARHYIVAETAASLAVKLGAADAVEALQARGR